jgi:methionyl-tRNA formyltransferase
MAISKHSIMTKTSKPIVFFGSGPVAAESLRLLSADFTIEAIVTKPRPPHHKGAVPVLDIGATINAPIYTVSTRLDVDTLIEQRPFQSKLAILIDFGIIVSQKTIDFFPLGIINSHFSLLPEWRGADPITFSILSGQKKTGVSLMMLTAGLDEGPLLAQSPVTIGAHTTTAELTRTLIMVSYETLRETIPRYLAGTLTAAPQQAVTIAENMTPSYSRKLTKEDGILDWSKPAVVLEREIRAFADWPKSRTTLKGLDMIITKAHVVDVNGVAGSTTILKKSPLIYCGQQALALDRVKPAGKQEMTGEAFIAGYRQFIV